MELQEVKISVVNNQIIPGVVIFSCSYDNFIPLQYIESYRKNKVEIEYIDSLDVLLNSSNNLFDSPSDFSNKIYVFSCQVLELSERSISFIQSSEKNVYIICKKVQDSVLSMLADRIVIVPKIESWQVEDLAYSMADGADSKDIQYILDICGRDINRLYKELEKINIFSTEERKSVVKDFIYDGIFNDLSRYNVFDVSTSIIKKDIGKLKSVYSELNNIDCDPLGLVVILLKNFRDIISVQCTNNPSPETCGLDTKKFWAVKYSCGIYSREQLIKIYQMLSSIDKRLKTGEITTDIIIDYIITYILSV